MPPLAWAGGPYKAFCRKTRPPCARPFLTHQGTSPAVQTPGCSGAWLQPAGRAEAAKTDFWAGVARAVARDVLEPIWRAFVGGANFADFRPRAAVCKGACCCRPLGFALLGTEME